MKERLVHLGQAGGSSKTLSRITDVSRGPLRGHAVRIGQGRSSQLQEKA